MKTYQHTQYVRQIKYANTVPTVPCSSNSVAILLLFISACRLKKCYVMYHVKFTAIHQNFTDTYVLCSLLYADNLMILYAAVNSLLMLHGYNDLHTYSVHMYGCNKCSYVHYMYMKSVLHTVHNLHYAFLTINSDGITHYHST